MAATAYSHLPSIVQSHSFTNVFDCIKSEKFDDHEYEISKWLKLENESLPSLNNSNVSDFGSPSNDNALFSNATTTTYIINSQLPSIQSEYSPNHNVGYSYQTQIPSQNNIQATTLQTSTLSASNLQGSTATYSSIPSQPFNTQFAPHYSTYSSQFAPYTTLSNNQYSSQGFTTTHYVQPQFSQNIIPTQVIQPQYQQTMATNGNLLNPQFQYLIPHQFHQIMKTQTDDAVEEKKRRQAKAFVRRVRQTRPKVVEAKGAVQCKGRNRKKGTQCRNAALMEYIGPRPIYCAEHIELDPKSLYEKCKSSYQKDPGDNKGCKEVVLKEFGVCYKHYADLIHQMIEQRDYETIRKHNERINDLLCQLEKDAAAAKKKDGDLYQRKNKLIPKFQEMKKLISKAWDAIESVRQRELSDVLPSDFSHLPSPLLVSEGLGVHIVEGLSSEDEDSLSSLSSPQSDSSLDDEFEQILN